MIVQKMLSINLKKSWATELIFSQMVNLKKIYNLNLNLRSNLEFILTVGLN